MEGFLYLIFYVHNNASFQTINTISSLDPSLYTVTLHIWSVELQKSNRELDSSEVWASFLSGH